MVAVDTDKGPREYPMGSAEAFEFISDTRKLATCGWSPARSLDEGLAGTVEWWRKTL